MIRRFWEETEKINEIVASNDSVPSDRRVIELQIAEWVHSPLRQMQREGEEYYRGCHDILRRKRMVIGADGSLVESRNLPNNRIVDNRYALMVDQKVNYLLGMPFVIEGEERGKRKDGEGKEAETRRLELYSDLLQGVFDARARRAIHHLGTDCLNSGIAWLYVYYGEDGRLAFRRFPAYEVLPIWKDDTHETLEYAIRLYEQQEYIGSSTQAVCYVEVYRQEGVYRYKYDQHGLLLADDSHEPFEAYVTDKSTNQSYAWERIPLIPFRYLPNEETLLSRVKTLQDALNQALSDLENASESNVYNTLFVLVNYDGEDLGEFRRNINAYGAVKVRSTASGASGDVRALEVGIAVEDFRKQIEELRDALIANARGFDAKDQRTGTDPNEMNIQSMYSDIDLDSKSMELEWQVSFSSLMWFVNQYLYNNGDGDYRDERVKVIFNRDIMVNETQTIDNTIKSMAVLSRETVVSQHPWVSNTDLEMRRIERQQKQEMEMDYETQEHEAKVQEMTRYQIQSQTQPQSMVRHPLDEA